VKDHTGASATLLKNFKELKIWQKAYQLSLIVYRVSAGFPPHEESGLTSRIRKASVSVPSDIAEGYGRDSLEEFVTFLYKAYGSNCEMAMQILFARIAQ
jgi:four helix bundle protein